MSIQFASPFIQSGPGIVAENDASAAAMVVAVDATQQTVMIAYRYGTATVASGKTTAFATDANGPSASVTFFLQSNTWQASSGASGNMTAGEITTVTNVYNNVLTAARNGGELFAFNHNVFGAGATNVPWQ